jgi:hypothetical protein
MKVVVVVEVVVEEVVVVMVAELVVVVVVVIMGTFSHGRWTTTYTTITNTTNDAQADCQAGIVSHLMTSGYHQGCFTERLANSMALECEILEGFSEAPEQQQHQQQQEQQQQQ